MTSHPSRALKWYDTIADRDLRPPYLPAFFPEVAQRLGLSGQESLLDIGCGFGDVCLSLGSKVGSITGLEPEAPMLARMVERARERGLAVRTVNAPIEQAPVDLGPFDVITMGKCYWYMDPPVAQARLLGWLKPEGRLLICGPAELNANGEPWQRAFFYARARWAAHETETRDFDMTPAQFLGDRFVAADRIDVYGERLIDLDQLVRRAFGYYDSTPAVLGDKAPKMEQDLRRIMGLFFRNGPIRETLHTHGTIFRRRDSERG